MAKGQYQIPFFNGNLLSWAGAWEQSQPGFEWRNNYIFEDELEYEGYSKGRSAVQMRLKSTSDGRCYNMSISDFSDCILKKYLVGTKIRMKFTFAKKGSNYMLVPIFE